MSRSLRRTAATVRAAAKAKSGRGWRGNWMDRLDIPKSHAVPVLLTPGEYPLVGFEREELATDEDPDPTAHYHTQRAHSVKPSQKEFYSSRCNLDAGDEDCLLCYLAEKGDRRVSSRYLYSFNCIEFGLFQRVPKRDKKGKIVLAERDTKSYKRGEPILVWEAVTKPRDVKEVMADLDDLLKLGEENEEEGVVLARKRYIEVGKGHRENIVEIDNEASKMCRCGGNLSPVEFGCEACDHEIAHVIEDNLGPEEAASFAESRQRCPACGHVGLPIVRTECDSCDDPRPLSAFDVVAYLKKKGTGPSTRIEIEKVVPLDAFDLLDGSSPIEWDEDTDEPIEDEEGNWVMSEYQSLAKLAGSQWNFDNVHTPNDHHWHAKRLGVEIPASFAPSTASNRRSATGGLAAKYRSYGSDTGSSRIRGDDRTEEEEEEVEDSGSRRSGRARKARRRRSR